MSDVTRRSRRYEVWLPVRIEELTAGMAVSHNASGRGMLLVTAATLEVGADVHVVVSLPPDATKEKELHGRVVRVEKNDEDPDGLWPHRMAVEFDEPTDELETVLLDLSSSGTARILR